MSGHSKWSTIKHKKWASDAKKGKIFGRISKEITLAVKQNGNLPCNNSRLRIAVQNAKSVNMPKDNIERAIKKGSSKGIDSLSEFTYEGYAAHGVAVIVECISDNINRTVASVRAAFNRYNGSLGKTGSLSFLFSHQGVFWVPFDIDEETLMMTLIEAGAETCAVESDHFRITCPVKDFGAVQKALEDLKITPMLAQVEYIPSSLVTLNNSEMESVSKLLNILEDNEDVQQVFHNMA